jgi:hypothetical protein
MEGVRRGPPNAVRYHGEEKEEEVVDMDHVMRYNVLVAVVTAVVSDTFSVTQTIQR